MSMRNRAAIGGVLAVILISVLALLPPMRTGPPKARAQHIMGVNNVRSVSIKLTITNAPPSTQPGVDKQTHKAGGWQE